MHPQLEGHTVKRYDGELGTLYMRVLEMGGLAADQLRLSLQAVKDKGLHLARKVVDRDTEVDKLELKVDQEIAALLARRCPVARDLRAVLAVSKAVTDLERVGDEAVKIAELALQMYDNDMADPSTALLRDVHTVGRLATRMLNESLECFDTLDAGQAEKIVTGHSELDLEFQSSLRRLTTFIMEDMRNLGHAIKIILILKTLERVGDHAKNLAEYVIFLVRGEDVRHQHGGFDPAGEDMDDDLE